MMNHTPLWLTLCAALLLSSCATHKVPREAGLHAPAVAAFKKAEQRHHSTEYRAFHYVHCAAEALRVINSAESAAPATQIYNLATADLAILLHAARQHGKRTVPLSVTDGSTTYQLRFASGGRDGAWDPDWFKSLIHAEEVDLKTIKRRNRIEGIGGALVGVRKTSPLEPFSPLVGLAVPVTAVLEFKGRQATLSLVDVSHKPKQVLAGVNRALAADFSAPLAFYPQQSELLEGLIGAFKIADRMGITGLYMLEPYDPDRIPVILVHGLISTPRMWRNVINELEMDPLIRDRYQFGVFAYPTGNPPLYSALRLREELEKYRKQHPDARDFVLVGHSMGGLISRLQATTIERKDWNRIGKEKAERLFGRITPGGLVDRATVFRANPHIKREVYICTPHRGSAMAMGSLGDIAISLISLPGTLASTVSDSMGASVALITGDADRMPTSITGLSPTNPTLALLDTLPIRAPHHSIIGDRGKGDSPNSSDGVVKYWSSHLDSAESEKIVPGPHGACEMPETIAELRRILRRHINHPSD